MMRSKSRTLSGGSAKGDGLFVKKHTARRHLNRAIHWDVGSMCVRSRLWNVVSLTVSYMHLQTWCIY